MRKYVIVCIVTLFVLAATYAGGYVHGSLYPYPVTSNPAPPISAQLPAKTTAIYLRPSAHPKSVSLWKEIVELKDYGLLYQYGVSRGDKLRDLAVYTYEGEPASVYVHLWFKSNDENHPDVVLHVIAAHKHVDPPTTLAQAQ